jgi:hypothetical protein
MTIPNTICTAERVTGHGETARLHLEQIII